MRCEDGDHRMCSCVRHAWLVKHVIPPGVEAATGEAPFVVVSFFEDNVTVHGSHRSMRTAKPARTRVGRRLLGIRGSGPGFETMFLPKTVAVVVCRWGHMH